MSRAADIGDDRTRALWEKQYEMVGDRLAIFSSVADAVEAHDVLYAGSYVDITPSFVWPAVTYVDVDKRANRFFADAEGVAVLVREGRARRDAGNEAGNEAGSVRFIHADYGDDLGLADASFDLLISLYAGFISEHCTRYLRPGGNLLVNASHGDAAMASIDDRYSLHGVVEADAQGGGGGGDGGGARVSMDALGTHLVPKRPVDVPVEYLHASGKAVAYTRSPWAYLFRRTT